MEIKRKCIYCNVVAYSDEDLIKIFSKQAKAPDGFKNVCQSCAREKTREYRNKNRKKKEYKDRRRISNIKQYGLTKEVYEQMLEKQNNRCAICKIDFSTQKRNPYIDHDHSCCIGQKSCGKCVRGLLCFKCNLWIGSANDDILILNNAIKYLNGEEVA